MVQQPVVIVEPEKNRPDDLPARQTVFAVAKAADDTVRTTITLNLLHTLSIAGLVWKVEALRDDAIASTARRREPTLGIPQLRAGRRKAKQVCLREETSGEILQK